jgi:Flp pilus assembly protein TadG
MFKVDWKKAESAQSFVEVALTLPIMLLILSGLLDLGRLYFTYVALEDGVGEAALYLSINPACRNESDGAACTNPNNAYFRAVNSGGQEVDWTKVTVDIERSGITVGETVKVTMQYPYELLTPILPSLMGLSHIDLTVVATQTIVTE